MIVYQLRLILLLSAILLSSAYANQSCQYHVATVTKQTHPAYTVWYGTVEAIHQGKLYAPAHGKIENIYVDIGDEVKLNQLMLTLRKTDGSLIELHTPYPGIITKKFIRQGDVIKQDAPLFEGFNHNELRIIVDIPQQAISMIKRFKNGYLLASDNHSYFHFNQKNLTIFPYINAQSITFKVKINIPKDQTQLIPGMMVATQFQTDTKSQIYIPKDAVVTPGEISAVYVLSTDCQPLLRLIRTGRTKGNLIEVISGLNTNEQILSSAEQIETVQTRDGEYDDS